MVFSLFPIRFAVDYGWEIKLLASSYKRVLLN